MSHLGKYDLILVRNTFHHFKEKERFLRTALNLLKRDGVLLLIDLDYESNFRPLAVLATHLRFFSTHSPWSSMRLLAKTHLFLDKAMREHRRHDRHLLITQGWYTAKNVEHRLKELYPDVGYRRIGNVLGFGGAYIARFCQNKATS